ncbi:hypothetical protein [Paenibacillus cucumis (ex Kampfer et al. 2016)]|uniref:Uncharacterized protein n=1 Tax=Paenibacillus cucumis (ex Kampfer et al. 2016) TaxID=1776858 RepID=A0ABS7KJZ4_9BACL|nr:hypothetical protein [Paenibacillus cucumis (ex Kampfer et al. 2016)]MBY0204442.1 hypothetical protein [Paenibacillus cucumis (ex Kampfer et al. 2016)]
MRFRWIHIVCSIVSLMMILTYINSAHVAASGVGNDVQVDEQTRQMLMEKYGLEPTEESQAERHLLSGDWGMSFSNISEVDSLVKLMPVVPFWLLPAIWIFRIWV